MSPTILRYLDSDTITNEARCAVENSGIREDGIKLALIPHMDMDISTGLSSCAVRRRTQP